jgi:hypothetical protein
MERPLTRFALLALPLLLGLSSLAAILVSPFAWGAGDDVGLPSWMPTASALVFGVPGLLIADRYVRVVRRRTAGDFGVAPLLLTYGVLAMLVAIAAEVVIAAGAADPATYESLKGDTPSDDVSPAAFLVVTAAVSLFLDALLLAALSGYASAITRQSGRYARGPDEPDGVGELLGRRNRTL